MAPLTESEIVLCLPSDGRLQLGLYFESIMIYPVAKPILGSGDVEVTDWSSEWLSYSFMRRRSRDEVDLASSDLSFPDSTDTKWRKALHGHYLLKWEERMASSGPGQTREVSSITAFLHNLEFLLPEYPNIHSLPSS